MLRFDQGSLDYGYSPMVNPTSYSASAGLQPEHVGRLAEDSSIGISEFGVLRGDACCTVQPTELELSRTYEGDACCIKKSSGLSEDLDWEPYIVGKDFKGPIGFYDPRTEFAN